MKNYEWIEVSKRLPKEGKIVNIELNDGIIIKNVLFAKGRFWKKRIGEYVGQTWDAVFWLPMLKEDSKETDKIQKRIDNLSEEEKGIIKMSTAYDSKDKKQINIMLQPETNI